MTYSIARPWLDLARCAFLEDLYRGRSVLCLGIGDGEILALLAERGAARVLGVDPDARNVRTVAQRLAPMRGRCDVQQGETAQGQFDVVLASVEGLGARGRSWVEEIAGLRKRVSADGFLVVAAANREAGGQGVSYFELADALGAAFPEVAMIGQSTLQGASLAPYGSEEAEPIFDTVAADIDGPTEPQMIVGIAGARRPQLGFGVVLLPPRAVQAAAPRLPDPEQERLRTLLAQREAELERTTADRARVIAEQRRLTEEHQRLQAQHQHISAEHKRMSGEPQQLLAEHRKIAAEHQKALADGQRLREELERAALERQGLLAARDQAVLRCEQLAADLAKVAKESAAEAARVQVEVARLTRERDAAIAVATELEERVHSLARSDDAQLRLELERRLAVREQAIDELRAAALRHAGEMQVAQGAIEERDAYIHELERSGQHLEELRAEVAEATSHAADAEAKERAARRRIAELEGTILRLEHEGPRASAAAPEELQRQVEELQAACDKLRARAEDAQREAWAHMKARSDAEAAAAEVREDTVRKLKDARKVANVELMRAMEEATRKAVTLKEELVRSERERKEALADLRQAREELAALQQGRLEPAAEEQEPRLLADLEALRASYQAQVAALQAARDELARRQAATADDEPRALRSVIATLEAELGRLRLALDQAADQAAAAAAERDAARAELAESTRRLASLSATAAAAPSVGELQQIEQGLATEVERAEQLTRSLEEVVGQLPQNPGSTENPR